VIDATGYSLPPEWAPQSCVWLVPPHNDETWPGCFTQAAEQFAVFREALSEVTPVRTPGQFGITTNDSWVRDFGPISVLNPDHPQTPLIYHDFVFNGWGGKYEQRDLDDVVPTKLGEALGVPVVHHDLVLEGGSIEVNGAGTVMTTEQCLLNENRNPRLTRQQIEAELNAALGTRHVVWLPGGIAGDDTDGHIDDVARFVAPDRVAVITAPEDHPDHAVLQRNLDALRAARDQDGKPFDLVELPVPEAIEYDFPPDRFGPGGRGPVPASYANFLISNGSVFVPVFGQRGDDAALRAVERALPGYRVTPIRAEWLVVGLGALHCLSMQQPAV
jgi:agmatine deiminase